MAKRMRRLFGLGSALVQACLAAPLLLGVALVLLAANAVGRLRSRSTSVQVKAPDTRHASIVIPNWNGRELLDHCLPSVIEAVEADGGGHEVIVVDNGSSDGSVDFLRERFPQVKVIACRENLGFGGGCNLGAEESRYDVVVMLNNDMLVDRGFLRPLLAGFADPRVFAVSAQIYFWDTSRRREETGKTRGCFFGGALTVAHDRPEPEEAAPSPVLYAGGGSSAFDRRKFLELGGFDELYRPFYWEDTDVSYRAWKRGWSVLFEPRSVVYHKHRGTIGRSMNSDGIRDVVERNGLLFVWRNVGDPRILLAQVLGRPLQYLRQSTERPMPARPLFSAIAGLPAVLGRVVAERALDEVSDREAIHLATDLLAWKERYESPRAVVVGEPLNVLVLCPYFPYPPAHGGATRMYHLIKRLAQQHNVYVLSFLDRLEEEAGAAELRRYCREVRTILRRPRFADHNPFGTLPLFVTAFESAEMRQAIRDVLSRVDVHIVQIDYTQMAHYVVPSRHWANVLVEHDISFLSAYRQFQQERNPTAKLSALIGWLKMVRYEVEACRRFDVVLSVTDLDRARLAPLLPGTLVSSDIPTGVDTTWFSGRQSGRRPGHSLLFVGYLGHTPNVDAVLYFCREVFPLIKRQVPDATLTVVGKGAPPEVCALSAEPSITFTGFVEDVRPYYDSHAVFVAPIRWGAGVRVKILEAMAAEIPVVTTTAGGEGVPYVAGRDLLVADSPEEFARHVVDVLHDEELADRLATHGRRLAQERYDWDILARNLERLYYDVARCKRAGVVAEPSGQIVRAWR